MIEAGQIVKLANCQSLPSTEAFHIGAPCGTPQACQVALAVPAFRFLTLGFLLTLEGRPELDFAFFVPGHEDDPRPQDDRGKGLDPFRRPGS